MKDSGHVSSSKDDKHLTTTQAAKIFKVSRFSVLLWIKQGKLGAISTPGGHHRVSKKAIRDLIKHNSSKNKTIEDARQKPEEELASIVPCLEKGNVQDILNKSAHVLGRHISKIKKELAEIRFNKLADFF